MPSFRPSAEVVIEAPLPVVWEVVLDTASYAEWNPFVERVDLAVPPAVGVAVRLHVRWADGSTARSRERIGALEQPHPEGPDGTTTALLSYGYEGWPARLGLVRSVRHQRLTQFLDGPTTYLTDGLFHGPLLALAGPARIQDGFERHAAALKARAEQLA